MKLKVDSKIQTPTFIIEKKRILKNIELMVSKARQNNVTLRPHFKTHQSKEIGTWFRRFGVDRITVSSVHMAEYFAGDGWDDILIAFPLNIRQMEQINALSQKIHLGVIIDNSVSLKSLIKHIKHPISVWLKIDLGYHRAGIDEGDLNLINILAAKVQNHPMLTFSGLLTHTGDNYQIEDKSCKITRSQLVISRLNEIKNRLQQLGIINCSLSIGDTPGIKLLNTIANVDEIRPGNFVFYDVMQYHFGVCEDAEIAVAVACPVVGKNSSRREIVIYGGAVHFSQEAVTTPSGQKIYGYMWDVEKNSFGNLNCDCFLSGLSQEHGILRCETGAFDKINIGDLVYIAPIHSCLTADLFSSYLTIDDQNITRLSIKRSS